MNTNNLNILAVRPQDHKNGYTPKYGSILNLTIQESIGDSPNEVVFMCN